MEYPPLPPSHPLSEGRCGDISTTRNLYNDPKAYILSLLFDKERVWFYVECYLSTVERIYRILHIPSFRQEVEDFWTNKQRPRWDWLAQFLMVIGIGYLTSPGANNKQAKRLLKAAEVCLLQMSFVLNPTIPTINALCMMVVAKHLGAMSCHEYDSCGPLMGIVIRHAMALGLHCDPVFSVDDMPIYEIEMRRRLWTTIVQLELQQSITSGTQPLLKNDDFNTLPPSNLNDDDIHSRGESFLSSTPGQLTDSSFQVLLASSFSLTFEIVSAANSLSGHLSYDRVTYLDFRIRELLTETSNLRGTLTSSDLSSETIWRALQISTLEITFRRILLILHLRYARRPRANIEYPKSYWSALECSLAILVHQRQIHEELDHHGSAKWFAELFKSDFFTAIITVGIQLCRKDNSALDGTAPTMETNELPNSVNSPRSTIVQTLKWCQDIWTSELAPSFCQSKVSQVIERIIKTAEVQT